MGIRETFEKQGGFSLIKQYWKGGAFFTAVGEFLLLGQDRKGLEILRLAAQYKIKKNLEREYRRKIEDFSNNNLDELPHNKSNKVWICWFQGLENAPDLVKKCYQSMEENLTDREIVLITIDNMSQYVDFPKYIIDKWKEGKITHTHMTDLLRLELLIKYGGTWIDSTVFCTRKRNQIPDYFFDSDLFFYQILKPGRDGQAQPVSSWFISAKTNNKILILTRQLCYEYWKKNDEMVDYFLFHDFLTIALEYNKEEWRKIVPRDNAAPHMLLLRLFDEYDEEIWNAIKQQTPFHKLTYKFSEEQSRLQNTFYSRILKVEN